MSSALQYSSLSIVESMFTLKNLFGAFTCQTSAVRLTFFLRVRVGVSVRSSECEIICSLYSLSVFTFVCVCFVYVLTYITVELVGLVCL